jgi:hypothetical protein
LKRTLTAIVIGMALTFSMTGLIRAEGNLTVRTSPPGAEARLEGEADITAVTPAIFNYPLIGEYRLTVSKHGFERYRTELVLDPAHPTALDVELTPKTGFKAALRSALIPGWGQYYGEQKTKGFTFGLMFAGAVTFFAIADHDLTNKENDFESRLRDFDDARANGASYFELSRLHSEMAGAQKRAYDAEDVRRISIGVVAGVWGLNVLDALLFTPTDRATFSVKGLTVGPSTDMQSVSVTLTKAF